MKLVKRASIIYLLLVLAIPVFFYETAFACTSLALVADDDAVVKGKLNIFDNSFRVATNSPPFDWHLTNLRNYVNLSAVAWPAIKTEGMDLAPIELNEAESKPSELSADDLAREMNNPNTPLAKLQIEYVTTAYDGDIPGAGNENAHMIIFKPAFPFPLNEDGTTNFFFRPVLAYVIEQPIFDSDNGRFESKSGLGDLGYDVALGKSYDSGLILIGGIQGTLPIGADDLTADQYWLGPEFIVAHFNASRVLAVFPTHLWDIAGDGSSYSTTRLEVFALKFLPGGWTVGTQPVMLYDWEAKQATIPLNLTVRKVIKIGNTPMQLSAGFDYYVEKSDDFGPNFGFKFSVTPVVPNFIYEWLK